MIERLLGSELRAIPQALIIPLGGASTQSVRHLSKIGVIDEERCLFGFPHPSGANAHRIKQFQEKYSEMESKLRMWFKRSA